MKKRISSIVLILLLAFVAAACKVDTGGGKKGGGNTVSFKQLSTTLDHGSVMLTNAVSVGISKKTDDAKTTENKKNYLVYFDEAGNMSDVVFLVTSGGGEEELRQEEIKGQIDKVFVAKRFTFIRFTAKENTEYIGEYDGNFYQRDYRCDASYQSFAIDNATGKVYSLAALDSVDAVGDSYIKSGSVFFRPEVKSGNLILTPFVTNSAIGITGVFEDKYGTVFVQNNMLNEPENGIVYYKDTYGRQYIMGSDGIMYVLDTSGIETSVQYYNASKQLVNTGGTNKAMLYNSNSYAYNYLIDGDLFYELRDFSWVAYTRSVSDPAFFMWTSCYTESSINSSCLMMGNTVFRLDTQANKLYHSYAQPTGDTEYYSGNAIYRVVETYVCDATAATSYGEYIMATKQGASTTQRYKVTIKNGTPKAEPVETIVYEGSIIVIQPLN